MTKLKSFKQKKAMATKNMVYALALIVFVLAAIVISKSYAIYKLEKKYDIIQSKIGNYPQGDVKVAVLVDGKETSKFPTYEDNYKVESVECSNGVNAAFDVRNWRLTIDDMSATSTKCTLSFNSSETNEETPIAYSKEKLLALNEEIRNTSAKELADYLYPVGSIYMSTEDDTVEKVQNKFGGTWVKYGENMTLVGASSTKAVNSTGGSSTVTLTNANLPSHNHPIPSLSGTATGGNHRHSESKSIYNILGTNSQILNVGSGSLQFYYDGTYYTNYSGDLSLTVKTTASNTNGCTNCNATAVNVQNPYTAVYMYKRTA